MANKIYKLNKKSAQQYFWNNLFKTLLIFFIIILSFIYTKNVTDTKKIITLFSLTISFGWFIGFGFPLIFLYINHSKNSKSIVLEHVNGSFRYKDNTKDVTFNKNQIEKIELWLTPSKFDNRIDWQYFGEFKFSKFFLNTGEVFEVSCLVFDKTEDVFSKEKIIKKKKFFPLLRKKS